MKKNYKNIVLLFVMVFATVVKMSAQMSGAYTINSAILTGGTNFQTFSAFATALNGTAGVNGPVVVDVVTGSGPYNEQVTFNQIVGMTSSNRVTINGNGCTLVFNSTNAAAPHTMLL